MASTLADWLAYIERQHPQAIAMGLARVREVAVRMGLTRPARRVITVAGTNGKGSTVAFVEAIARAAGWRVGAYTSPHLLRYNERVRVDGRDADDDALVAAFAAVDAARRAGAMPSSAADGQPSASDAAVPLTYFEFGTLAALWLFERSELDLAVLEVGLGGRLDAVNLIDPDVAVITTVDLDHQAWLGEDREAIGAEKAGIVRAWRPLVLGEDDPPSSVLARAYALGASAIRAGSDFFFEPLPPDPGTPPRWRWRELGVALDLPMPRLTAPAQLRNAATAIAALRALDVELTEAAYGEGVAAAHVPGRLQRVVHDGVDIVIDVGHNPQAARALAAWLRATPRAGRTVAVYAALADKDAAGVAQALADDIDRWHLAGLPDAGARACGADDLARRLAGTAAAGGARHATVADALAAARAQAAAGDRILVFGSFYAAAAALRALAQGSEARGDAGV